jgi:hypothetical protein
MKKQSHLARTSTDYEDHADKSTEWVTEQQRTIDDNSGRQPALSLAEKFPVKLHQLLENVEDTEHATIVRWLGHGASRKNCYPFTFSSRESLLRFRDSSTCTTFEDLLDSETSNKRRTTTASSCEGDQTLQHSCLEIDCRPILLGKHMTPRVSPTSNH